MKNLIKLKHPLIIGTVIPLFLYLVMAELIQGGAAYIAGSKGVSFTVSGIKLHALFLLNTGSVTAAVIYLIPYFVMFLSFSGAVTGLKKALPGYYRHLLIVIAVVSSGLLIFSLFQGGFSIVLGLNSDNDYVVLKNYLKLSQTEGVIAVFLMVILTGGYLNLLLKRILTYIKTN